MLIFFLPPYIFYAVSIGLLLYRVFWKDHSNMYALLASFLLAFLIFKFERVSLPFLLSGVIIFNTASFTSESKVGIPIFIIGIAYGLYYILFYQSTLFLLAQAIFLGLLIYPKQFRMHPGSKENKMIEKKRDIFQTMFGIIIIIAFMLLKADIAYSFFIVLVLLGYLVRSFVISFSGNIISKYLVQLEREGVLFGRGAVWLALGSLLSLSFVNPINFVIIILSAILIADPLATLVGIKTKGAVLPYNRDKTIFGFLAYFLVVFFVSSFFVPQFSVILALIAAVVESLPMHIDDNFDVPLVLVLFLKLIT